MSNVDDGEKMFQRHSRLKQRSRTPTLKTPDIAARRHLKKTGNYGSQRRSLRHKHSPQPRTPPITLTGESLLHGSERHTRLNTPFIIKCWRKRPFTGLGVA